MNVPKIDLSKFSPIFGYEKQIKIVYLRCPNGHISILNHDIDINGKITPSVQCPKCNFHESDLILDNYT